VSSLFLAGLVVAVWVWSWWGPRPFRLWFALLSPFGAVAAIVLAFMSVPRGSCDHGCVEGWANNVDSSEGLANALMTFPVAVAIAVITGIVELVLLVRRNPPARTGDDAPWTSDPAAEDAPRPPAPPDQDPGWNDLIRGSRRT
jgi:hypothetical protein